MGAWGTFERTEARGRLADGPFDVLVVGGGITGAGVALDAASRGLRTALVERDDFASGTSSRSSKLVHGGLRYLQNGEVRLVYEALHERQRLLHNAPHLVRVLPFLIPIFSADGLINRKLARALGSAMWLYDATGGLRIGRRHKRLTTDKALSYLPTLRADKLASAYLYYDAQTDDARLTLAIVRTAVVDHGAVALNGARLVAVHKDGGGRVQGATVEAEGSAIDVRCAAIVNATGVWVDDVRALDEGQHPESLRPAKGVHVTVPWTRVGNTIAAVVPVSRDRRSVFVVPWGEQPDGTFQFAYIGTTDADYDGPLDEPQCTPDDIAYLLGALNRSLTTALTEADVVGTWAGLRPLVKADAMRRTADLSRRHRVTTSPSGVITITGGKLTTYREMAEDAVDEVLEVLGDGVNGRNVRRCRTARLRLRGAEGYAEVRQVDAHLADRFGGDARAVLALAQVRPELAEPLVPGLPYRRAEAVHAVRHEMARNLDDVLARRTRARLVARDATAVAAGDVAELIGAELGWSPDRRAGEVEAYRASVERERNASGVPGSALDRLAMP